MITLPTGTIQAASPDDLSQLRSIVYAIVNSYDGKTYIGKSANTFRDRYGSRWWNRTTNIALKRTLKYAKPEDFAIYILEHSIPASQLNGREKHYATALNTYCPHGYNIRECGEEGTIHCPEVREKVRLHNIKLRKLYRVRLIKTGEIFEIGYVKGWCKEHGIHEMAFRNLLCGIVIASQGYCMPDTDLSQMNENGRVRLRGKTFTVRHIATGESVTFNNAVHFARVHGIRLHGFKDMLNGRARSSHGYCLPGTVVPSCPRIYQITSPQGQTIRFYNLSTFQRDHDTNVHAMMYHGAKENRHGWSNLCVFQEGTAAHRWQSRTDSTPNDWLHSPSGTS